MHALIRRAGGAGAMALALALAGMPALTFAAPGHHAPIKGIVTAVSGSSLQVQTQTGSVNTPLTASTHVARKVAGSTADLTPGLEIDVQLVKGTTTISAIDISSDRGQRPASSTPKHATGTHHTRPAHPTGTHTPHANLHQSGQIVSLSGTTIKLQNKKGQVTTYTLSSNVTVTKTMAGHLSDLQVGQSVQVFVGRNGAATSVEILNG